MTSGTNPFTIALFQLPLFLVCVFVNPLIGQKLSVTKSQMTFTSNAELEMIKATSGNVQGLIDPATNEFAFAVNIKTFQGFNSALQREHFNEKYMESEKFPRATFHGKIIEPIDFSADQSYHVRAKGELNIHGRAQRRIIKAILRIDKGMLYLETSFVVPLSDHDITIPTIVSQKIATEIEVEFSATMSPQDL
jgi:hypothetical protein